MTAGERLRALAGVSGTAGALLLLIGSGATAGAALVDYSGLPTATAAVHLMADVAPEEVPPPQTPYGGIGESISAVARYSIKDDEDELIEILAIVMPIISGRNRGSPPH